MKNLKIVLSALFIFLLITTSCSDKDDPVKVKPKPDDTTFPLFALKINEFIARGSENENEFGQKKDWFEIYNPTDKTAILKAGKVYFSDDNGDIFKYALAKDTSITPQGFLVIWCDGFDIFNKEIHTNFNLNGDGESIVIVVTDSLNNNYIADSLTYSITESGISYGRNPDGSDNWAEFSDPTPGKSNN